MVFDAVGVALGGLVRARFRFTVFRDDDGGVMARAQERIASLPFVGPSKETLANEHRHTLRDLNASFLVLSLDRPDRGTAACASTHRETC